MRREGEPSEALRCSHGRRGTCSKEMGERAEKAPEGPSGNQKMLPASPRGKSSPGSKGGWVGSVLQVCGSSAQGEGPARKVGPQAISSSNNHMTQGVHCVPPVRDLVSSSVPWEEGARRFPRPLAGSEHGRVNSEPERKSLPGLLPEERALCALCLARPTMGPCAPSAWHG